MCWKRECVISNIEEENAEKVIWHWAKKSQKLCTDQNPPACSSDLRKLQLHLDHSLQNVGTFSLHQGLSFCIFFLHWYYIIVVVMCPWSPRVLTMRTFPQAPSAARTEYQSTAPWILLQEHFENAKCPENGSKPAPIIPLIFTPTVILRWPHVSKECSAGLKWWPGEKDINKEKTFKCKIGCHRVFVIDF